jgi:uncharacterized protein
MAKLRRAPWKGAHLLNERAELQLLGAELGNNRYGEFLIARQWYATPSMYSSNADCLRLLLPAGSTARAARLAANPAKWLFLDTETTGFARGAGTYAFLVGLAWWDCGGIRIEQLFMRDHQEEYSVLLELARRMNERPVLVTFNGKSFDWPLLETRFRMTRAIKAPPIETHLDFLHPARQIWRLHTGSVRLSHLERTVLGSRALGWSRRDDLDSSCIPQLYFDYLSGRSAARIESVFRHNRMDLRGLAALAGRVLELISDAGGITANGHDGLELYGIARLLARQGEHARARVLCSRALELGVPDNIAEMVQADLARIIKRGRRLQRAAPGRCLEVKAKVRCGDAPGPNGYRGE